MTTQADVDELVAAASMPPGYALTATPRRKFKYRSLWEIRVIRGDEQVFARSFYNPPVGIAVATAVAWGDSAKRAAA